jgi:hypothetical protein
VAIGVIRGLPCFFLHKGDAFLPAERGNQSLQIWALGAQSVRSRVKWETRMIGIDWADRGRLPRDIERPWTNERTRTARLQTKAGASQELGFRRRSLTFVEFSAL